MSNMFNEFDYVNNKNYWRNVIKDTNKALHEREVKRQEYIELIRYIAENVIPSNLGPGHMIPNKTVPKEMKPSNFSHNLKEELDRYQMNFKDKLFFDDLEQLSKSCINKNIESFEDGLYLYINRYKQWSQELLNRENCENPNLYKDILEFLSDLVILLSSGNNKNISLDNILEKVTNKQVEIIEKYDIIFTKKDK